MRNGSLSLAVGSALLLTLGACSQQTQEHAKQTADAAGNDIETAANHAGDAVQDAARDASKDLSAAAKQGAAAVSTAAGKAAHSAGDALDDAGRKTENGRAKVEADAQGESVEKAKRD